jgi:hypothetical protein
VPDPASTGPRQWALHYVPERADAVADESVLSLVATGPPVDPTNPVVVVAREDVRSALEDLRIEFQGFVHEPERRAALLTLDRVEAAVLGSGDGSSPVGGGQ